MFEYTYINVYVRACMYRHVYVCASMNLNILLQCDDADDDRDDDDDDGDGGVNDDCDNDDHGDDCGMMTMVMISMITGAYNNDV